MGVKEHMPAPVSVLQGSPRCEIIPSYLLKKNNDMLTFHLGVFICFHTTLWYTVFIKHYFNVLMF